LRAVCEKIYYGMDEIMKKTPLELSPRVAFAPGFFVLCFVV
jgi:hypothetical protein